MKIKNSLKFFAVFILILFSFSTLNSKEKNLSETQLEFYYLTSPSELEKKLIVDKLNELKPIDHSKIFYGLNDFLNIEKKLSNLNNLNEKKTQKK